MKSTIYRQMIKSYFTKKDVYSHLIVVIDNENSEFRKFLVKRTDDIKEIFFEIVSNKNYEIKEIYNLDMDYFSQIEEPRPYHINKEYNKMNKAFKYAQEKHENQFRKDNTPYINHPFYVGELIKKYCKDSPRLNELVTAAYLHDVVEDTNSSIEEVRELFGDYVAYLVNGVTNDNYLKHKLGKTEYLCTKMIKMPSDVLNLKLCDRLSNVIDLDTAPEDFQRKYILETRTIINNIKANRELTNIQKEIISDIEITLNNIYVYHK